MMAYLFSHAHQSPHPQLLSLRDEPFFADVKEHLEFLWRWLEPFADPNFVSAFAVRPQERWWEMYVAKLATQSGAKLKPTGPGQPDLLLEDDRGRIWIEATCPGPGDGPDANSPVPSTGFQDPDSGLLRLCSAIHDKCLKIDEYIGKEVIRPEDRVVLAINTHASWHMKYAGDPPRCLRAAYGIGRPIAPMTPMGIGQLRVEDRRSVMKRSGAIVRTDYFYCEEYRAISLALFSSGDVLNADLATGSECILAHNPHADCPVQSPWLRRGREYTLQNGSLVRVC